MATNSLTLESVRHSLIRQEDSIIFSLIERAHFPINSPTYSQSYVSNSIHTFSGSLLRFVVEETEAILAKVCMCCAFFFSFFFTFLVKRRMHKTTNCPKQLQQWQNALRSTDH